MDLRFKSFPPLRCCFDLGRGKTLETKETKNCRISGLTASGHITLDRGYKALQLHIVFKLIQISSSTYLVPHSQVDTRLSHLHNKQGRNPGDMDTSYKHVCCFALFEKEYLQNRESEIVSTNLENDFRVNVSGI